MATSLCKMKKRCKTEFDNYVSLVDKPRFVCLGCGRAANRKKNLCKPRKIENSDDR